ncbi:hypothetical protein EX30DRAFT_370783 [Ascodesmis nigricans]|uniref:Uncharacterized protein n=1 Tax=Ascodesmis nigricans TaxID=341454 RepID=A0A4V3SJ00_9PEZI|nr:hypothetical protein EX30DRAFT_370783 [Ascodesmis nigricans]
MMMLLTKPNGKGRVHIETDPVVALPLTAKFLSESRPPIRAFSEKNESTAQQASILLTSISTLLDTHNVTATTLRSQLPLLPSLSTSIAAAESKARSIAEQLQSLDRLVTELVAEDERTRMELEVEVVRRREEEELEKWMRRRRTEVEELKRGYVKKLVEFAGERREVELEIGSAGDGGKEADVLRRIAGRGKERIREKEQNETVNEDVAADDDGVRKDENTSTQDELEGFFTDSDEDKSQPPKPSPSVQLSPSSQLPKRPPPAPSESAHPSVSSSTQPPLPPPSSPMGKKRHSLLSIHPGSRTKGKIKATPAPAAIQNTHSKSPSQTQRKRGNQLVVMDEDVDINELEDFYK